MKLSTSLIAVKKINSPVDRSTFSENALNNAATSILKAEGLINPLVVKRLSLDAYEVVNGHLEYYAAVRAREIDPLKGETIGAFIIDSDNEAALQEQVEILRSNVSTQPVISPETIRPAQDHHQITTENKLENLTAQVDQLAQVSDRVKVITENKLENLTTKVEQLIQASDRVKVITENKLENLTTKVEQLVQAIALIQSLLGQLTKAKTTSTTQPKPPIYKNQTNAQLQEELDRREIKVTPKGKKVLKSEMIASLEADDKAKATLS